MDENNAINYIKFLQEYKKLLERGVKDIFVKSVSDKYIWIDDIRRLINDEICESSIEQLFDYKDASQTKDTLQSEDKSTTEQENNISPKIFILERPGKPIIVIPDNFKQSIVFNDIKNEFKVANEDIEDNTLQSFYESEEGKKEKDKLSTFFKNKKLYSKLYRAYNDIKFDSNIEIVLSVGLIQYRQQGGTPERISKINQHLFHFPLKIELVESNKIKLSFSDVEAPYADFFFLNNTPISKRELDELIGRFDVEVNRKSYTLINLERFNNLIKDLERISENASFKGLLTKPTSEDYPEIGQFKISYSPAINIKRKKPRFFNKLTEDIIKNIGRENYDIQLFKLLIRNSKEDSNSYPKSNYFIDELYDSYKNVYENLDERDFSAFFPLPFNKEQKQIYENYLENRVTVVTGPPGTGKSHTIVNILCTLLAQGKRVLVTAQTDKALESLLEKIPKTFDDLVFTKIQIETDKTRFSLESSIENIKTILQDNQELKIDDRIDKLNEKKREYLNLKSKIFKALEKEYQEISLNDSFQNLRSYKLWEKIESIDKKQWNWLTDNISLDTIESFEKLYENIKNYFDLLKYEGIGLSEIDFNIEEIQSKLQNFDFERFLSTKKEVERIENNFELDPLAMRSLLDIDISSIIETTSEYSGSDIVVNDFHSISQLKRDLDDDFLVSEKYISNLPYSEIINNSNKYLRDIQSYLSHIESKKEKIGWVHRKTNKNYKEVKYLEDIVLNENKCDNRTCLDKLSIYINILKKIDAKFKLAKEYGYKISIDEDSGIQSKLDLLNSLKKMVYKNYSIVILLQTDNNIRKFSTLFNIGINNIEAIYNKAKLIKKDLEELIAHNNILNENLKFLNAISIKLKNSELSERFNVLLPVENLPNLESYNELLLQFDKIKQDRSKEHSFSESLSYLKKTIPNTLENLKNVPSEYITKENLKCAHANIYFEENNIINFQKTKQELNLINDKIYSLKSEILYELAKNNFKNSFNIGEVDSFINLLEKYKNSLRYANGQSKDRVKHQILARKNSREISGKLSCWVMKFNDVLNSVGSKPEIFDCIIVDEASQLDFNSILLGYYAKNMIIVGDDKQTSPSALTGVSGIDFGSIRDNYLNYLGDERIQIRSDNSLFSLAKMVAGTSNLSLIEHFRCVPEIIEFSKFHFYNNSLIPLKQINASNRLKPLDSVFINDSFLQEKIVIKEIEHIKNYLKDILQSPIYQNKTIGVVSLGVSRHTEKLKEIKEELKEVFCQRKLDDVKLLIEESPKFQGDERDIMLISLGVALDSEKLNNNENPKPRAIVNDGRIKDETKKINVALSRAKEQMILFHSVKLDDLRPRDFRREIISFFNKEIQELKEFQLPRNEGLRNRNNVPVPFDSWFEYDIAKNLIDKGYKYIEPQYKIKEDEVFYNPRIGRETYASFKLDLVVTNNRKKVAIECDGDPFHSLPEDVEYDIERQEFLERIGWKVYRILYSAFKRNPEQEINNMIEFIEENTKEIIDFTENFESKNEQPDSHIVPLKRNKVESSENINITNDDNNKKIISPNLDFNVRSEQKSFKNKTKREKTIETNKNTENNIICYFNLYEDRSYKIQNNSSENSLFSIAIKESQRNDFLLQCYDSGRINKVSVDSILEKTMNREYSNGLFQGSVLKTIKILKPNDIIGIYIKTITRTFFKAHYNYSISTHQDLNSQGNKVIYNKNFINCEFIFLPESFSNKISRLIFTSLNANGKSIKNDYYNNEWASLRNIPNI